MFVHTPEDSAGTFAIVERCRSRYEFCFVRSLRCAGRSGGVDTMNAADMFQRHIGRRTVLQAFAWQIHKFIALLRKAIVSNHRLHRRNTDMRHRFRYQKESRGGSEAISASEAISVVLEVCSCCLHVAALSLSSLPTPVL